ncbi:MAG: hypothetical protein FWG20_00555 [Candidatus Cloacimonetes bacterium]|nr:hypothetical protein [Candidatus Cloacimonadota bacterium]
MKKITTIIVLMLTAFCLSAESFVLDIDMESLDKNNSEVLLDNMTLRINVEADVLHNPNGEDYKEFILESPIGGLNFKILDEKDDPNPELTQKIEILRKSDLPKALRDELIKLLIQKSK